MPKCPTCDKQVALSDESYMPFCSERCKMIDLGKWLEESYTIPDDMAQQIEEDNVVDPAQRETEEE